MDVVVFGKHADIDAGLKAHTLEKLGRVQRYAADVRRVDVDYSEHPTRRHADSHVCEILVHLKQRLVKGRATAVDHLAALEGALDKVEQQMRRLHERRVHRRNGLGAREPHPNGARPVEGGPVEGEPVDELEGAPIVKTKRFDVKPMDPHEAALQMELLGHDFFLFTSTETGRAALLYRRRDGDLGMIEASG